MRLKGMSADKQTGRKGGNHFHKKEVDECKSNEKRAKDLKPVTVRKHRVLRAHIVECQEEPPTRMTKTIPAGQLDRMKDSVLAPPRRNRANTVECHREESPARMTKTIPTGQ
jgi:hypothetical protein